MHAPVQTNYPLTAVVKPGRELHFTLISNSGVASSEGLAALMEQWLSILKAAIGNPALPIRETTSALAPLVSENEAASDTAKPKVAASTQLESKIAGVWAEAFGRAVSINDNFFDLGGHSLMMMRVRARLNAVLGREIPVVKLFQHPTISALAKYLGGESCVQNETLSAKDRAAKARAALTRRPLPPTRKS
jgi:aryl carrier-like protein